MFKNVFGSGFLVRTAHVILTWVITLILFLHDTDLRKKEESGDLFQPVLFVLLVLVSVLLYFAVSLMDPGFVLSEDSDAKFSFNEEQHGMIIPSAKSLRQRRCIHCMVQQPMRAKHCQTCQHCVRRYDHHCPWIENCVGERNHRWFVLYLAVQLLVLVWGLHMAWQVRVHLRPRLGAVAASTVALTRTPSTGARSATSGVSSASGAPLSGSKRTSPRAVTLSSPTHGEDPASPRSGDLYELYKHLQEGNFTVI
ncbi:palmitoyltransferase ZDHHC12-B isoform X2 [Brienomyrus brachyistius]|uniref:palmitoyltransferase ZDHHC12-B isoform X2 n=1 Tax=Brienomyrus brachyistius TaxID=42636 RepID=UPI0020B18F27|nr:palmitoyltransferase ZDHHC12-B isoform X2 [Brienomyrus brachyistius]